MAIQNTATEIDNTLLAAATTISRCTPRSKFSWTLKTKLDRALRVPHVTYIPVYINNRGTVSAIKGNDEDVEAFKLRIQPHERDYSLDVVTNGDSHPVIEHQEASDLESIIPMVTSSIAKFLFDLISKSHEPDLNLLKLSEAFSKMPTKKIVELDWQLLMGARDGFSTYVKLGPRGGLTFDGEMIKGEHYLAKIDAFRPDFSSNKYEIFVIAENGKAIRINYNGQSGKNDGKLMNVLPSDCRGLFSKAFEALAQIS